MGVVVGVPGMAHAGWLVSQFRSVPGETKRTGATAAPAAQRLSRRSGAVWRHTWPGVTWPWLRWRHNSGHVIREPPVTSPDWKPVQRAEKSATRSRRKLGNRAKLGNGRGGADGDPFHRLSTFFFCLISVSSSWETATRRPRNAKENHRHSLNDSQRSSSHT